MRALIVETSRAPAAMGVALAVLTGLFGVSGCGGTQPVRATSAQVTFARIAVGNVLDDFHAAAAAADEERYFGHFTVDGVFLGTDATERWGVEAFRAYAHPHFARGKAWTFRATRRDIELSRDTQIAWFDEDLETEGLGPARGTGVLRRGEDGRYRIAQYNLTITVPNERFREVRELLEGDGNADGNENANANANANGNGNGDGNSNGNSNGNGND